ncbi:MAG: hypothetical protein LC541_14940 [Candidatus Thiodiazotropha sp.]|nr:hypothetical protein [Candidatus Thiodiazotropha sp.]
MTGRRVRMLALHPLWRKARRVYSLASRLPGTNRLGFQPSLALSGWGGKLFFFNPKLLTFLSCVILLLKKSLPET